VSETRQARETRLADEYQKYVAQCASDKVEAINFVNWSFNAKIEEKADAEDRDWLHKTIGHAAPDVIEKAKVRKAEREAKAAQDAADKAAREAGKLK